MPNRKTLSVRRTRSLVSLLFLLGAFSCGESPLLNHKESGPAKPSSAPESSTKAPAAKRNCDLDFHEMNICGTIQWKASPEIDWERGNSLDLQIWNKGDQKDTAIEGELSLKPFMPSMGHGVRENPLVEKDVNAIGLYHISNIFFSMTGEWELWFVWTQSSGKISKAKLDLVF